MSGPAYLADPPARRVAVDLESLVAVFHEPSGTTHLLVTPAPEILQVLEEGPADAVSVLDRLARDNDVGGADALAAVEARLRELETSGLIWRA